MTKHQEKNQHCKDYQMNHNENWNQNSNMGNENPQYNSIQTPSYNTEPSDFIPLWEQMGASTGGLIGRFIGLNFYAGAAYLTNFLAANPMQNPYSYPNSGNQMPNPYMPVNQNTHTFVNQSTGPVNNQPNGYFVTIQTDADNEETVQKIIKDNHGQL